MAEASRRSLRLPEVDYSQAGAYFITCVIHERENLLGQIQNDAVQWSYAGKIVQAYWEELPGHFHNMESVAFVIMPNHVHGIILLKEAGQAKQPLSEIVRAFKSFSARRINLVRHTPGKPVWQRNYYEHIIRDETEMARLYDYVIDNPRRWSEDHEMQ